MYSQITRPLGIGSIRIKERVRTTCHAYRCYHYLAGELFPHTWVVWDGLTGFVQTIFYCEPNIHGWCAAEAHARSYLNRYSTVNPFELDSVP